ncbi:lipopolysaccharide biosynthesis protein [Phycicoccus avicenniae]|uniref:lipopolysaccharide biosynthesis protein n=1 Tax=Phycicoccus avicenniae TaxID=2828860 RepID=UPI003D2C8EFC
MATAGPGGGWRDLLRPLRLDREAPPRSLAKDSALSMVGLLAQGGLRFVTSWLVGRLAGRAVLGALQSAMSTASLLALLGPTSVGSAASKYLARARATGDRDELHAVAVHLRQRAAVLSLLLGGVGVAFWVVYDGGRWVDGLWVGLFTAAWSGYSFTRGVLFGTGQVRRATAWDLLSGIGGVVVLVVALLLGLRGPALLAPLVLSYTAYVLASWPRVARAERTPLARPLRRELDEFVLLGITGTVASAGFLQVAMIVAKGTGPEDAGQFAASMATATPASLLAVSLSLALFPSLAESWARGDTATFLDQTDRAARVLQVVMVSILGSLAICSQLIMAFVWGPKFDPESPVLPALLVAITMTTVAVPSVNALVTRSRRLMRVTTGASFAGLCTGALVWWLLGPSSAVDVAVGFLAGSVVSGAVPLLAEWRVGRHRWGWVVLRLPLAVLLVVGAVVGQRALGLPVWAEPLTALLFVAVWWVLCRRDLALVPLGPLARFRRRPGDDVA